MVIPVLHCPHCPGTNIVRHGTTRQGKPRYRCRTCPEHGRTFLLAYAYAGQAPDVKRHIVDMACNASGIRDTARGGACESHDSPERMKKKDPGLPPVHPAVFPPLHPAHGEGESCRAAALTQRRRLTSEREARWRSVGKTAAPQWWWAAIDHRRGTVLASVLGRRQATGLLQRKECLEPCGITRLCTEGWGADERHLAPEQPTVGTQPTPTIASKPLNLRTRIQRLVRRTIGFSKTTTMHDLVIGLFINRYEFGGSI